MTIATLTRTSHIYDYAYTVAGESRTLRVALQPEVFTVDNDNGPEFYTAACFLQSKAIESVEGIAFEEGDSEHNELEATLAALNADDVYSLASSIKADIGHVVAEAYEAAGESSHDGYTLSGVSIGGRGCPDSVFIGELKTAYDVQTGWYPRELIASDKEETPIQSIDSTAPIKLGEGLYLRTGADLQSFQQEAFDACEGDTELEDQLDTVTDYAAKAYWITNSEYWMANDLSKHQVVDCANSFSELEVMILSHVDISNEKLHDIIETMLAKEANKNVKAVPTRGVAPATQAELEARNVATITPNAATTPAASGNDFNM